MGKLTPKAIEHAQPGRLIDGDGLHLLVKPSGRMSWVLRVQQDGKRRDVGLGTVDTTKRKTGEMRPTDDAPLLLRRHLTLGEAREKARLLRDAAKAGRDPIVERDKDRTAGHTFEAAARAAHLALKGGWAAKNAAAFLTSLEEHAFPSLGKIKVADIESSHIRDMLQPIWLTIPVMARKVRQRISTVLNFAHSNGWRATEAPGRSVTVGLPRQPKGGNFEAMPYADVPALTAQLKGKAPTIGRQALLFQMLTAARPGEVRRARWGQIDFAKRDWNRPASMMKTGAPHTVTLSNAALQLLMSVKADRTPKTEDLVFAGPRGAMMSDMTMTKALRTAGYAQDVHGFRSSFRDWAAETIPEIPDPVAEAALAHEVPDEVVRAYKRTKFIEMRRELLEAWGAFCVGSSKDVAE